MAKRKGNPAFLKKHSVSDELQEVIKAKKASRGECIKLVWKYIKKHGLNDGRTINPDKKMAVVFGRKSFDMMKLAGKIFKCIS